MDQFKKKNSWKWKFLIEENFYSIVNRYWIVFNMNNSMRILNNIFYYYLISMMFYFI